MADNSARSARIASVAASTGIALACGTNYAYSAWGPDFAERMQLSATQSNVIGLAGNMGMYAMGIPAGILVDSRGPRWGVLVGAISLACGYFPIYKAYVAGPGSVGLGLISFCSFLTGMGSCTAFSAAIKTSAFNWPDHRGTATAFPLSGFGLSAFFFAALANLAFSNNTGDFLLLLAAGTLCLNALSFLFLRLIPTSASYSHVPSEDDADDNRLHLTKSADSDPHPQRGELPHDGLQSSGSTEGNGHYGGTSSLASGNSRQQCDAAADPEDSEDFAHQNTRPLDISGLALVKYVEFWQLFAMMGLLAGVGLMTINNIGNDAKALWHRRDPNASPSFITGREQMHTSILSVGSFMGRFISGVGSDYIVKRLHASRFWCLVISASVFTLAQVLALNISNPNYLFLVSSLTGIGYGALFGCFPALTADAFGVTGMSQNWGFMICAPVITGNIYNLAYGRIYDAHTPFDGEGKGECPDGLGCYQSAYFLTLVSSIGGIMMSLWCIRYERRKLQQRDRQRGRIA